MSTRDIFRGYKTPSETAKEPATADKPRFTTTPKNGSRAALRTAEPSEAKRIAAELVNLWCQGLVKDDPEAAFYASLIHQFGASFTGKGPGAAPNGRTMPKKGQPYKPSAEQLVHIPQGLTRKEREAFLARD